MGVGGGKRGCLAPGTSVVPAEGPLAGGRGGGGWAWGRGGMAGAKLSSHPASGKAPQAEPAKVLQMF